MNWFNLVVVIQVLSALAIIGLVLLQHGKGADMGAAFGSGASGSLFGASGSSNFLSKSTAVAAVVFFGSTLVLAAFGTGSGVGSGKSVLEGSVIQQTAPAPAPAAPAQLPPAPTGAAPQGELPAAPAAPAANAPAAAAPAAPAQAPAAAPGAAGTAPAPANQIPK
jgi:preprotein translocase subunit SecG